METLGLLAGLRPTKPFLIGVDSDGCAFDTMDIKHKECFIPNTIKWFGLQPVARYAREAAEFVNLYSKWRGLNRFPALLRTLDLLAEREEVQARNVVVPHLPATRQWLARESKPANPALENTLQDATGDEATELRRVLGWSRAVNEAIAELVRGIPPFPGVRESLQCAVHYADILVVSATPAEALQREWNEHGLAAFTRLIAGQEMGTKADQLRAAAAGYPRERVLMIGDAPGDLEAARASGVCFYPIEPGAEAESWKRFLSEALELFLAGRYAGVYEEHLIKEFEQRLPDTPPWRRAVTAEVMRRC